MATSLKTKRSDELVRFARRTAYIGIAVAFGAWAASECAVLWGGPTAREVVADYQSFARTPIFTSFFTMGSFLIALKTTILGRIKDTYETQAYRDSYRLRKEKNPDEKYYAGLENLGKALGWNVVLCLVAAFTQMTLGFWSNTIAFSICVGVASCALVLLVRLTLVLMSAHKDWFLKIEEDMRNLLDKLDRENEEERKDAKELPLKCRYPTKDETK
jgi:hypothetical protein